MDKIITVNKKRVFIPEKLGIGRIISNVSTCSCSRRTDDLHAFYSIAVYLDTSSLNYFLQMRQFRKRPLEILSSVWTSFEHLTVNKNRLNFLFLWNIEIKIPVEISISVCIWIIFSFPFPYIFSKMAPERESICCMFAWYVIMLYDDFIWNINM